MGWAQNQEVIWAQKDGLTKHAIKCKWATPLPRPKWSSS